MRGAGETSETNPLHEPKFGSGTTSLINLGHPKSTHCVTFEITAEYEGHSYLSSNPTVVPATSDIHEG